LILAYMLLSVVWAKAPGISFMTFGGRELITLIMLCLLISEEFPR